MPTESELTEKYNKYVKTLGATGKEPEHELYKSIFLDACTVVDNCDENGNYQLDRSKQDPNAMYLAMHAQGYTVGCNLYKVTENIQFIMEKLSPFVTKVMGIKFND